jgi:hypothetical protein
MAITVGNFCASGAAQGPERQASGAATEDGETGDKENGIRGHPQGGGGTGRLGGHDLISTPCVSRPR